MMSDEILTHYGSIAEMRRDTGGNSQTVLLESGNIGKITYKSPKVGDVVDGKLLWGEDIKRCKIFSDAGISRDAFIVQTEFGDKGVMLEQNIIAIVERDGVKWEL